ncbi:MAG: hypothetical protein AAF957_03905 [Planctomycetota bacterium]
MPRFPRLVQLLLARGLLVGGLLVAVLPWLAGLHGCGSGDGLSASRSRARDGVPPADPELVVTIDGRVVRARACPALQIVDGRVFDAVVVAPADAADVPRMTANVVSNDAEAGSYRLVRRASDVVPSEERLAHLVIEVLDAGPAIELRSTAGTLVLRRRPAATGAGEGPLAGSFSGTFVDGTGLEHVVDGYWRPGGEPMTLAYTRR